MQVKPLLISKNPSSSFSIRNEQVPNVNSTWHCHPEIELICFHKGSGTQFVGDSVLDFRAGDAVIVGSNLPHYWRFDYEAALESPDSKPYSTVIHFQPDIFGEPFVNLPEMMGLRGLLKKASRGLLVRFSEPGNIHKMMFAATETTGMEKMMLFLSCLQEIAQSKTGRPLSSIGFSYKFDQNEAESNRLGKIYDFSLNHYHRPYLLDEVASVANLSPTSFCRYFKSATGKTYSRFLQELRIGQACKQLLGSAVPVKQISYNVGYRNLTSFYETFKNITGKTPREFLKSEAAEL